MLVEMLPANPGHQIGSGRDDASQMELELLCVEHETRDTTHHLAPHAHLLLLLLCAFQLLAGKRCAFIPQRGDHRHHLLHGRHRCEREVVVLVEIVVVQPLIVTRKLDHTSNV